MNDVRSVKLTREMELEALQKVYDSQRRLLYLTEGQRRRIARITKERLAAVNGSAPHSA